MRIIENTETRLFESGYRPETDMFLALTPDELNRAVTEAGWALLPEMDGHMAYLATGMNEKGEYCFKLRPHPEAKGLAA